MLLNPSVNRKEGMEFMCRGPVKASSQLLGDLHCVGFLVVCVCASACLLCLWCMYVSLCVYEIVCMNAHVYVASRSQHLLLSTLF